MAKVFESVVLDSQYFHLKKYLINEQHSFLKGRSTMSYLLVFQEFTLSAFSNNNQVDYIYLNLSKAVF